MTDILPAIDIRGGRCVRLAQGDYARETVFGDDPVAMAQRWVDEGARRLHVVDLDGAKDGRPVNDTIVARIVAECAVPVQVTGGMRSIDIIRRWAAAGAARIVIGTAAVREPELVDVAVAEFGDRIAVSVDAREGKLAVQGWLEKTDTDAEAFIAEMARRGVQHFIYTDITRDGMMQHIDFAHIAPIVETVRAATGTPPGDEVPLTYAGGITSLDDVLAVAAHNVEGVISGRALYDGGIDLRAALRALASSGDDW